MASTWTNNIAIEKIADGEKTDTWGQITNRNFDIVDRATNGVGTIDLSSSAAAHTLSTTDGTTGDALSDGMYKVLILSGATEACTITISPNDAQKFYVVINTSGYDATFTQGTGDNVVVANNATKFIYADGAGAAAAVAEVDAITADANGVVAFSKGITEESVAITSDTEAATLDLQTSTNFTHTLTENVEYTFSNPAASGSVSAFTLKVTQDSTTRAITWPTSVDWNSATAPTITTTSGGVDVFVFITYDGGTTYYGFTAGQAMG